MGRHDPLICYHAGCSDGFTAAWAAWRRFGDEGADYLGVRFDATLEDLVGVRSSRTVYFLDVVPEDGALMAKIREKCELTILDHHPTGRDLYGGWPEHVYSEDHSGAWMAWTHFHDTPPPRLVAYVEDRDLWRFALPSSRAVNALIHTREKTFEEWDRLADRLANDRAALMRLGSAIRDSQEQMVTYLTREEMVGVGALGWVDEAGEEREVEAPFVNTPALVSDVCHRLIDRYDYEVAGAWHRTGDQSLKYSLRATDEGPDVARIAEHHGGGGHPNAAGFRVPSVKAARSEAA